MTRYMEKPGRVTEARRGKRHRRRALKSPCDRPPITPTGLEGTFLKNLERTRHRRWHLRVKWDEVSTDTSGFTISPRHYVLEVEHSADDVNWFQTARHVVPAKDDSDPNEKVHFLVKNLNAKLAYRWRVRVVASGKNACKSAFTAWQVEGTPGVEEPPAPTDVRIYPKSTNRIVVDWDTPHDTDDDDVLDFKVSYFQFALMQDTTAAPTTVASAYKGDRFIHKTRVSFKVRDLDEGSTYYGWVRTVGEEDGDVRKSAWIPAWDPDQHGGDGNSNPLATPDGVTIGKGSGKTKHPFSVKGFVRDLPEADCHDIEIDELLTLKKIRVRLKQAAVGASVTVTPYKNNTTALTAITLASTEKRGAQNGYAEVFDDEDTLSYEIDVGASPSTRPKNMTIVAIFE